MVETGFSFVYNDFFSGFNSGMWAFANVVLNKNISKKKTKLLRWGQRGLGVCVCGIGLVWNIINPAEFEFDAGLKSCKKCSAGASRQRNSKLNGIKQSNKQRPKPIKSASASAVLASAEYPLKFAHFLKTYLIQLSPFLAQMFHFPMFFF